jgi:site-specific recombinase XerD
MATIKLELKNVPDKKGRCKIRIQIQDRGRRKFITTDVKVLKSQWDAEKQKIVDHPSAKIFNSALELRVATLDKELKLQNVTTGGVDLNKLAGEKMKKTLFNDYALKVLDGWEKQKRKTTMIGLRSKFNLMMKFDPEICIEDIDATWLKSYQVESFKTCTAGGVSKRLKFISTIIKQAMRDKIITADPFKTYQLPKIAKSKRTFLTFEEIDRIEKMLDRFEGGIVNVGRWFLLSCYTGLRHCDVTLFDSKKMIQAGRIMLYTTKTDDAVSIKLDDKLKRVIKNAESCGKVLTNQKCNEWLKLIADRAGIDKRITFHTARHSFAVGCANLGISIEACSRLMGHDNIATTQIYYKIINPKIDDEMKRWENRNATKVIEMDGRKRKAKAS